MDVKKKSTYLVIRSEIGGIEIRECSYSELKEKCGNKALIENVSKSKDAWKNPSDNVIRNFVENREILETENREKLEADNSQNTCVIPTLFKLHKNNKYITCEDGFFEVALEKIYDNEVVRHLKKDMIFNAVLPAFGAEKGNKEYTYINKNDTNQKIVFKLPIEKNIKMLFMRLCDLRKGDASNDDTFAQSAFVAKFNKKEYPKKGYVKFNMAFKDYPSFEIPKETSNKFCLYDEAMGCSLIFECWTEYLPIPGESDGVFAYLDGSSEKTGKNEGEKYGTGYVISNNKEIQFGHTEGIASEANYAGEIEAVTNILKNIGKTKNLKLYFDNTAVGYYPGKYFDWSNKKDKWVIEYRNIYNDFVKSCKDCNIEFVHIDAHFSVFGNEMADRLAQVCDGKLVNKKEYVEGYKKDRESVCPNNGSFSDPFILKE